MYMCACRRIENWFKKIRKNYLNLFSKETTIALKNQGVQRIKDSKNLDLTVLQHSVKFVNVSTA